MHIIKNLIVCLSVLVLLTGCERQKALFVTSEESGHTETSENMLNDTEVTADTNEMADADARNDSKPVAVYVCGAVKNPGVYYLNTTDIKDTAIQLAGGFSEEADTAYVNLAEKIAEGERIYVPTKEETEQGIYFETEIGEIQADDGTDSGKVNINTAGKEELMTLPGIGESKAEAILAYREAQGKFQSTDELMNIRGIKEGVYNKIKDLIVVN